MTSMGKYKTIVELSNAFINGEIDPFQVTTYMCKYELFINDKDGKTLFSEYYGTFNACADICALLGIEEPKEV